MGIHEPGYVAEGIWMKDKTRQKIIPQEEWATMHLSLTEDTENTS